MQERIDIEDLAARLDEVIGRVEESGRIHIIARKDEEVAALVAISTLDAMRDEAKRQDAVSGSGQKSLGSPDVKSADVPDSDTLMARIDALRAEVGMKPFGEDL